MKTMAIVGAGRLLGLSLARQFGKHDFQIALVARNEKKLSEMKSELEHDGVKASYHIADIYDKDQITSAFQVIYKMYGDVDLLEFSPTAGHYRPTSVLELQAEQAEDAFIGNVVAAIRCTNQVLPSMLKRKSGALLFTTGLSAIYPNPQMADSSIAKAGLRSYISNLQTELTEKNIFVGHISLGIFLKAGTGELNDPESVAKLWYEKYSENRYGEEVYPEGVTHETVIR
ncbi:SDR family oxidoreductase [Sporolactobacillus shoreicorticis]|uniref:SDR family NAD(P)-dependent oxidoreductase n=1 Tax=Sporolactobacillus shoreicorticis TaxID=1923877 RepID=A0ABW5S088_9BACL|nr:SDR family NAD(P)-dependent oxidoreductase [Sporolactobacillus shoreicorticis]MCO7124624.1 SDR family oxidoreductase [Sporolactobacillus shoreicorticis]